MISRDTPRDSPLGRRQNGFTVLRLCAAFSVLVTHSYSLAGRDPDEPLKALTQLTTMGSAGVDVFFAISGFLVCGSLLRQSSAIGYLRNRALRILPGLAAMTLLTVFIVGPLVTTDPHYWSEPSTWRYLLGMFIYPWQANLPGVFADHVFSVVNVPLWTLPLEVTCYLMLLGLSWSGALNWRGLVLLGTAALVLHLTGAFPPEQSLLGMSLLHLDRLAAIFCGGALLATLGDRVVWSGPAGVAGAVAIVAAAWWGRTDWHRFAIVYIPLLPYVVITAAHALRRFDWLNRWDISYGVYIYGFLVQQCVVTVLGPPVLVLRLTLLAGVLTACCALASWLLVEKPALGLKGRALRSAERGVLAPARDPVGQV